MEDKKAGRLVKYPTEIMNAVTAAEKAAEMVQEASERFLEELNRGGTGGRRKIILESANFCHAQPLQLCGKLPHFF